MDSISESTRSAILTIARVASQWIDVDHPERTAAEKKTLAAPNRFTQEALVFAINQQMSQLTEKALTKWATSLECEGGATVGVLNPGNVPFSGLQDFLGIVLSGHSYVGTVSSRSPALLPEFAASLERAGLSRAFAFEHFDAVLSSADALIASGTDETMSLVREKATRSRIEPSNILLRGHRYSVAVLDGKETADELIGLAEDMLLHEGLGCRNVAILFAPVDTSPDAILDAMSAFRNTFPAHEDSRGALKMQQAYLHAVGIPHAYGDEMQFLLSRGEPDVQTPPHIRWSDYDDLEEVRQWISARGSEIQLMVSSERLKICKSVGVQTEKPGFAQRPRLGWKQDGIDLATFLKQLVPLSS